MKKKKFWKRLGIFILDFFEVFTPAITFSLLFIAFMVQVFYRYFLVPLTWPLEFTLIAFIWTTLFGACFAMRDSSHVKFGLIYDMAKPKTKIWMRIIGNVLLIFSFCIALFPTYRYIDFMSFKRSNVLKIPMNIAFSPFIVFMLIMIGRIGYNLFIDMKKLYRGEL